MGINEIAGLTAQKHKYNTNPVLVHKKQNTKQTKQKQYDRKKTIQTK
jgi:hypothetical protein